MARVAQIAVPWLGRILVRDVGGVRSSHRSELGSNGGLCCTFTGGELLLYAPLDKEGNVMGRDLKVNGRRAYILFDATQTHEVLPYTGVRRSLSYFIARGPERLSAGDWGALHKWGFPVPACLSLLGLQVSLDHLPVPVVSPVKITGGAQLRSKGGHVLLNEDLASKNPIGGSAGDALLVVSESDPPGASGGLVPPGAESEKDPGEKTVALPPVVVDKSVPALKKEPKGRGARVRRSGQTRRGMHGTKHSGGSTPHRRHLNFDEERACTFVGTYEDLILPLMAGAHSSHRTPLRAFVERGRALLRDYLPPNVEEPSEPHYAAAPVDLLPCGVPYKRNPIFLHLPLHLNGLSAMRRKRRLK
eukprot:6492609-Amphidinium_carterae.2